VNFPGSADSAILGINALGDYVGTWDSDPTVGDGPWLRAFRRALQQFRFPDEPFTQANDLNERGQVVGVCLDANGLQHGFLKVQGLFSRFDLPEAASTSPWGINDRG